MSNDHLHPIFKQVLDSFQQIGSRPVNPAVPPSITVTCNNCGGTGGTDSGLCRACGGQGYVWTNGGFK